MQHPREMLENNGQPYSLRGLVQRDCRVFATNLPSGALGKTFPDPACGNKGSKQVVGRKFFSCLVVQGQKPVTPVLVSKRSILCMTIP